MGLLVTPSRRIALGALALAALVVLAIWTRAPGRLWALNAIEAMCAVACLARAARPHERAAWLSLGLSLAVWSAGDIGYQLRPDLPTPSIADAAWLAFYPFAWVAVVLLTRTHLRSLAAAAWLDGLVAALAAAAVGAACVFGPVAATTSGSALAVGVNLAYPLGDLALLALAVFGLVVGGRGDRRFVALAAGLALTAAADGTYLVLTAAGTWPEASALDALWPLATAVIALGAWASPPARTPPRPSGLSQIVVPVGSSLLAMVVVGVNEVHRLAPLALAFALATLLVGIVRLGLTFGEKERALARLHLRATTDPLTDLPNHREFHERLAAEVERARRHARPLSVAVLDLDHFKQINDVHGHPVGDRALVHVATTLREMARPGDTLARIGGEEFGWILPETPDMDAWQAVERARESLLARPLPGIGSVSFSAGVCDLSEVASPLGAPELVRLADGALYWAKRHGRAVTFRYSPSVVTALSAEELARSAAREQSLRTIQDLARSEDARDPHTVGHSERVADLAAAMANALGWSEQRQALMREAALVHDIGKIGVPDDVLMKPGPLTRPERDLVELHPAAGARIVAGALTEEQAGWIRGHHERWDGGGYPDRLAGHAISEGAAILAISEAFAAMSAARNHRDALSREEAIAECRREAGTQFSPATVEALARVVARGVPGSGAQRAEAAQAQ